MGSSTKLRLSEQIWTVILLHRHNIHSIRSRSAYPHHSDNGQATASLLPLTHAVYLV